MKMKIKKFTGHSVDVKSLIAKKRAESPAFRAAYDEARSVRLLSRALAELRERSGLTQAQLAKRLHTTQAAISRLESPHLQKSLTGHAAQVSEGYWLEDGHPL
jgi:ribosome-binding protein aMBF1 (putative translation factor)